MEVMVFLNLQNKDDRTTERHKKTAGNGRERRQRTTPRTHPLGPAITIASTNLSNSPFPGAGGM
jgi:hypothetical protein